MRRKLQIISGLGLLGLGYWASGSIRKKMYDDQMDYLPSLLIRRNKHAPMEHKERDFAAINFSIWNQTGVEWNAFYHERYFNDEASYQFDPKAIKQLAEATYELHNMCLEAVDNVIKSDELMDLFEIPNHMRDAIKESWDKNEADLLGRFDFLFDGIGPPKMIEYNADTPTLLVETGRAQAVWAKPKNLLHKQFNYITNALKFGWEAILGQDVKEVTFAGQKDDHAEEWDQLGMLRSTLPPGVKSDIYQFKNLFYEDGTIKVSLPGDKPISKDISWLWKLYPWEWLCVEQIGEYFGYGAKHSKRVRIGEPPWKMIISNKALLAYLWQLYPNHPNLIPAFFTDDPFHDDFLNDSENKKKQWVGKPKFSRGGEYIVLSQRYTYWHDFLEDVHKEPMLPINDTEKISLGKRVLQEFYPTPHFNGRRITIGSWVIFGAPAGIGVREDIKDVVYDNSSFVPHYVQEIEPSALVQDGVDLKFHPSTQRHEAIRKRLYGEAGDLLINNLYGSKNEYWDVDVSSPERPYYRTHHGGGGGGYYGYAGGKTDDVIKNRQTFAEKVQTAARKRALRGGPASRRVSSRGVKTGSVGKSSAS